MIAGMLVHDGDIALAGHLMSTRDNAMVSFRAHGLWSADLASALAEMCGMAAGTNTRKPLVHVWASPLMERDDVEWEEYWDRFEIEFGLVGAPYVEVTHLKFSGGGRVSRHRHRAYLRIALNGRVIPMRWSAPRLEKLSRIDEFMCGEPLTSGVFNRSVIRHLREEGLDAVAEAMISVGLDKRQAVSRCSPAERAAATRLGDVAPDHVKRQIFTIVRTGATGANLARAFDECGYRVAQGDKAIVVVTPAGNRVPVLRGYNKIAGLRGCAKMYKADLDRLLAGVDLPMASSLKPAAGASSLAPRRVGVNRREQPPMAKEVPVDVLAVPPGEPLCPPHDIESRAPGIQPVDPDRLTPDQVLTLRNWMNGMFANDAPEGVLNDPIPGDGNRPLADPEQLGLGEGSNDQPRILRPGWKEHYKADLAGLPASFGDRLTWIDRVGDMRRVRLKSHELLTVTPGQIASSVPSENAAEVMVQLAVGMNWNWADIRGGTREWREATARFCVRAGIDVISPELQDVVLDERELMKARDLVNAWLAARHRAMFNNDPDKFGVWMRTAVELRDNPRVSDVLFPEDMSDLRLDLMFCGEVPYRAQALDDDRVGVEPEASLRI